MSKSDNDYRRRATVDDEYRLPKIKSKDRVKEKRVTHALKTKDIDELLELEDEE